MKMKSVFILLLCLACSFELVAQDYLKGREISKSKEYDKSLVYFVGIIHINSPVVISCKEHLHQSFIMSRKDFNNYSLDYKFLNKEYVFLLEYNTFAMPWTYIRKSEEYLITDWHTDHFEKYLHGGYALYHFDIQPDYYQLYLIRGDAYNRFTFFDYNCGGYDTPLDFPEEKAYYKMVVPYWNH